MSKEPDPTWVVVVSFDPMWNTYSIDRVMQVSSPYTSSLPPRYLMFTSPDELGAYQKARTHLQHLGFETANP